MCRGRTRPGKSTVPSGKTGIIAPTRGAYRSAGPPGRAATPIFAPAWIKCRIPVDLTAWNGGRSLSDPQPRLGDVLNRIDLRGSLADPRGLLPRAQLDVSAAVEKIRPVVEAVRDHGFTAIREAT